MVTHVFGEPVVVSAQAEDEVAGLPDVDAVPDVLEQEGEPFPSGQSRHVTLRQSQVSGEMRPKGKTTIRLDCCVLVLCSVRVRVCSSETSPSVTAPRAGR